MDFSPAKSRCEKRSLDELFPSRAHFPVETLPVLLKPKCMVDQNEEHEVLGSGLL